MKNLIIGKDRNLNVTNSRPESDHNNVHYGVGPAQFYIPATANVVAFSVNDGKNFAVKMGASPTAHYPSGEVSDGSASMINPEILNVVSGELISISGDAADTVVGMSFYSL